MSKLPQCFNRGGFSGIGYVARRLFSGSGHRGSSARPTSICGQINAIPAVFLLLANLILPTVSMAQCFSTGGSTKQFEDLANNAIGQGIQNGSITKDTSGNYVVYYGPTNGSTLAPTVSAAFAAWNAVTSTTGISFQPAPSGTTPTIATNLVTNAELDAQDAGCVASSQKAGGIYYDPDFTGRESGGTTSTNQNKQAVEHEIGHLLGLKDNSGNTTYSGGASIMNQVDDTGGCSSLGALPTTGIQPQDASNASTCSKKAQKLCAACAKKNG